MKFFEFDKKESKVGLYSTLIFHLIIIIILLATSLNSAIKSETSFVLDFSKQEEVERKKEEQEFKEMVSDEIDKLLAAAMSNNREVRNVAVNVNQPTRTNQQMVAAYADDRELQKRLDASKAKSEAIDKADQDYIASLNKKDNSSKEANTYQGPSVISYSLEGREATHLPVPAYKGYESGDVSVIIMVNNAGRVVEAKVMESVSTKNTSLIELALQTAKRSRFTASQSAPKSQQGEIVYRFIGQKK